ncbi:type II toxin-antitoxin system HicB family antitoxin [Acinetobacter sp. ANC 5502]
MSYLKYKGYLGTIEPDLETGELFGKLAFIRDLVTYEAETLKALEIAFQQSVDGYLEACAEVNKQPDQPFKGTFNVRISPELHRKAVLAVSGHSLNAFVSDAIQEKLMRLGV